VRGNKDHVASHGYACEKAQRIDYYQSGKDRLDSPLRRRADGTFEKIDWDTAIAEVAARLMRVRDELAARASSIMAAADREIICAALQYRDAARTRGRVCLQRARAGKNRRVLGRRPPHRRASVADFEHAEVAVFVGKNPWQSHGFQSARPTLRKISPIRIARSSSSIRAHRDRELADYHLQVRPGTDAFCLSALLAVMVQEDLIAHEFLREHATAAPTSSMRCERFPSRTTAHARA